MAGSGQLRVEELAKSIPELLTELRPLSAIKTAATFAGLLTQPALQANCLRLEALAHFSLLYCKRWEAPAKGFVRRAFDCLSEGYFGGQEDPAEDVFVALVNTPRGNWRVFEGHTRRQRVSVAADTECR